MELEGDHEVSYITVNNQLLLTWRLNERMRAAIKSENTSLDIVFHTPCK